MDNNTKTFQTQEAYKMMNIATFVCVETPIWTVNMFYTFAKGRLVQNEKFHFERGYGADFPEAHTGHNLNKK
jgi:hypothetical protein